MTPKQIEALRRVSRFREGATVKWESASGLCSTPGVMGSLVRRGLVRSVTQEERPLHEGTIRYGLYQITEHGLDTLAATPEPQGDEISGCADDQTFANVSADQLRAAADTLGTTRPTMAETPYTIAEIDAAIEAIVGRPMFRDVGSSRPHQMLSAASKAWIEQRPEDHHSDILRAGLQDLNKDGSLHPHDGVWPNRE